MRPLPPHWTLHTHDWVGSTNTVAEALAAQGAPEGTVVVAQGQEAGRGRWGRSWESPYGKNLYISVILRPKLLSSQVPALSLVAGLATARMLAEDYQVEAQIKWPNDIWLKGHKLGGILAELQTDQGAVTAVILGLGINVNAAPDYATSLAQETGRSFALDEMVTAWCVAFNQVYQQFLAQGFPALQQDYQSAMALVGESVRVDGVHSDMTGVVTGVDAQGWLQLIQDDGRRVAVDAGEVIKLCCS